ncbi:MAG: hypothetical protein WBX07_07550 [Rhodoplanes sp.]
MFRQRHDDAPPKIGRIAFRLCHKTPAITSKPPSRALSAAVDRLSEKQDRSIGELGSDNKVRIIVSFGGFCRRPVPHGRFLLELGPRSGFGRAGLFCVYGPRGVLSRIMV